MRFPVGAKTDYTTPISDLYGFALEWKESAAKGSVTRFFRREDDAGDLQRLSARIREALDRFNVSCPDLSFVTSGHAADADGMF